MEKKYLEKEKMLIIAKELHQMEIVLRFRQTVYVRVPQKSSKVLINTCTSCEEL